MSPTERVEFGVQRQGFVLVGGDVDPADVVIYVDFFPDDGQTPNPHVERPASAQLLRLYWEAEGSAYLQHEFLRAAFPRFADRIGAHPTQKQAEIPGSRNPGIQELEVVDAEVVEDPSSDVKRSEPGFASSPPWPVPRPPARGVYAAMGVDDAPERVSVELVALDRDAIARSEGSVFALKQPVKRYCHACDTTWVDNPTTADHHWRPPNKAHVKRLALQAALQRVGYDDAIEMIVGENIGVLEQLRGAPGGVLILGPAPNRMIEVLCRHDRSMKVPGSETSSSSISVPMVASWVAPPADATLTPRPSWRRRRTMPPRPGRARRPRGAGFHCNHCVLCHHSDQLAEGVVELDSQHGRCVQDAQADVAGI